MFNQQADLNSLGSYNGELSKEQDIELAMLTAIHNSSAPLGAVSLSLELQHTREISQATIGRKLKEFDVRGLTERVGYQGRRLTPKGEEYLRELLNSAVTARRNEAFLRALKVSDAATLIQVLEARRALERECTRLATMRMKEADAQVLQELLERQRQTLLKGEAGSYENMAFHEAIARLSQNDVLAEALRLVRSKSQLTDLVGAIRQQVGGVLVRDHQEIIDAMIARDPERAEQAMAIHIDRLIDDVRKFFGIGSGE